MWLIFENLKCNYLTQYEELGAPKTYGILLYALNEVIVYIIL